MYLRFITQFQNENDELETGIFQAMEFLRLSIHTFDHDKADIQKLKQWFNKNLDRPTRFSKSKSKNPTNVALSWFKNTATEHLRMMYQMKEILERYDMHVEIIKRENPGYIIYEDEFQVSTIPHGVDKNSVA